MKNTQNIDYSEVDYIIKKYETEQKSIEGINSMLNEGKNNFESFSSTKK